MNDWIKYPPPPKWYIFTSEEVAALLTWWLTFSHVEEHRDKKYEIDSDEYFEQKKKILKNSYVLSSNIFNRRLKSMSNNEGFNFEEWTTGFNILSYKADKLMTLKKNCTVLLAADETMSYIKRQKRATFG